MPGSKYDPSNCTLISSGSWTVTTAPNYGTTPTGIVTGTLGNGDCPGIIFPFAAIYYKWTSADPKGVSQDSFAATWSSPDYEVQDDVAITLIVPINYQQMGPGVAEPGGVLHFNYTWASTTGNVADLTQCMVGEHVSYPGGDPFVWPSPPYNGSTPNPTVIWLAATLGALQDNHSHKAFLEPYVANAFDATQNYRYKCRDLDTVNFPGFKGITIARTVTDRTGRGCWSYEVKKSGYSASVPRLPGVQRKACQAGADSDVPQPMPDFNSSAAELGMSVAPPEASAGLHAPIFIDLTVFNRSAETVAFDLGLNKKANLELTITEPGGGIITRTLSSEGIGALGEVSLPPGEKYVQRLLLNEWYEFPEIGSYQIKMTLLADPFVVSGVANADRPSTEFSVDIGPRDPAQLERISRKLADTAIGAATLEESMQAANALSYIQDPVAVPSLARVLQQGSLVEQYAVDGLGRIGTPEAIAALEAAQNHPDEDVRGAVRAMIERLQKNKN